MEQIWLGYMLDIRALFVSRVGHTSILDFNIVFFGGFRARH